MVKSPLDDLTLVKQYMLGNERVLSVLIQRHKRKIYAHIYKIVQDYDLADDIFQETFIKVIHTLKMGKYNEEGKFLPWVMRIAYNLSIDEIRKDKKSNIHENNFEEYDIFDSIQDDSLNREDVLVLNQTNEKLNQLIELLPDDQKEVIKLRHYSGLSFKEIAEETNVSINTALGRMRYALINMRKLIEEHKLELVY